VFSKGEAQRAVRRGDGTKGKAPPGTTLIILLITNDNIFILGIIAWFSLGAVLFLRVCNEQSEGSPPAQKTNGKDSGAHGDTFGEGGCDWR
jgi:hypothetical protein